MLQNSELDARTGAPSDFGPAIEKSPDALYGDPNAPERPSNRRDGIARVRAIVSEPGVRADQRCCSWQQIGTGKGLRRSFVLPVVFAYYHV
jgi:hypothetical protein